MYGEVGLLHYFQQKGVIQELGNQPDNYYLLCHDLHGNSPLKKTSPVERHMERIDLHTVDATVIGASSEDDTNISVAVEEPSIGVKDSTTSLPAKKKDHLVSKVSQDSSQLLGSSTASRKEVAFTFQDL